MLAISSIISADFKYCTDCSIRVTTTLLGYFDIDAKLESIYHDFLYFMHAVIIKYGSAIYRDHEG